MCRVSYVVPVYNAQDTLLRCVESLAYGIEQDFEIVLSDDWSTDQSWDVCLKLQQQFPNIVCIRNPENSGVSRTRNAALDVAKGEYVLFVDSDDWVTYDYADTLLRYAIKFPEDLVLCGFHFKDYVNDVKMNYVWDESDTPFYQIERKDFFQLVDKVLMQQLWNKVFRREIIERAHVRFDETKSMGEDFGFVLDYLKAANIRGATIINQPLYSYLRVKTTSLMSKFGVDENTDGLERMGILLSVCGDNPQAVQAYQTACKALTDNYAYQVMRAQQFSKQQKLSMLKKILGEGSERYYKQQRKQLFKEKAAATLKRVRIYKKRVESKLQRMKNQRVINAAKKKLPNDAVALISQNCIGGVFYHDMGLEFRSPTINLFFKAADFVKFVLDLERYLSCELTMAWGIDYPIGKLDDIDVHFMHYESCEEAKAAWERRKERICWDNIVVISTDMEGFDEDVFAKWKTIPYPKVLFTVDPAFASEPDAVHYPKYQHLGCVPDLIPKREFYKDDILTKEGYR